MVDEPGGPIERQRGVVVAGGVDQDACNVAALHPAKCVVEEEAREPAAASARIDDEALDVARTIGTPADRERRHPPVDVNAP